MDLITTMDAICTLSWSKLNVVIAKWLTCKKSNFALHMLMRYIEPKVLISERMKTGFLCHSMSFINDENQPD